MGRVRGTVNAIMAHLAASFQCRLHIRHFDHAYSSAAAYECNRLCRHGSGAGGAMRSRMGELRFRIGSFQQGLSWRTDIGLRFPQMRKTGSTAPGPVRRKRSCADSFPYLARWFASLPGNARAFPRSRDLIGSNPRARQRKARLRGGDGRPHRLAESWGFASACGVRGFGRRPPPSRARRGTLARSLGLATSSVRIPACGREKARLRGGDGRSHRLAESWGFEPQIPLWGILA